MAVGASPLFQVPPFVEIAARGRVVPGELGGAAVHSAGAGVAKASEWRLGVRVAASSLLQHRHAWSVPSAEQAKPCLACHAQRRWRQAGCWRAVTYHAGGDRARRSTGLSSMRTALRGNDEAEGQAPERLRDLAGEIIEQARHVLKEASQTAGGATHAGQHATSARERAALAKRRELAAHARAIKLHEQAAELQERLGHPDRAAKAPGHAEHARELKGLALAERREQERYGKAGECGAVKAWSGHPVWLVGEARRPSCRCRPAGPALTSCSPCWTGGDVGMVLLLHPVRPAASPARRASTTPASTRST